MIPGLIFAWAQRAPDRTALIYNGRGYSYRDFAQRIALARGYFTRRGIGGEGYAVLALHNLLDSWVLSLALRSLGLTTLPVGSTAAVAKLALPNVRCVVTSPEEKWPLLDQHCAARGVDLLTVRLGGEPALHLDSAEAARCGGHVLRTSGTTGEYKMVLMTPEFDGVFLRRRVEAVGMNENTVLCVFNFLPWTGIGYKWAASPWLVGGATLIHQEGEPHLALRQAGMTHAKTIPAMVVRMLAAPPGSFPRSETMQLIYGGGTLTRAQLDEARARITPLVFSSVSSTEADNIALTPLLTDDDMRWHRPAPNRRLEIVDADDRPVADGTVGRLRVGAAGGPQGYLGDDAATGAFFKDGFFYPGDLAVKRADGRFALEGRVTDVLNVRGRKISPAPIEEQLANALGVGGVCLFSTPDGTGEEVLHVVVETSQPLDDEGLASELRKRLPAFRAPAFHVIDRLPRNPMGKVARGEVRAWVKAAERPPQAS
jgi:acyl-coenzyme A synthetase/AMP-(fatty) acid ligase